MVTTALLQIFRVGLQQRRHVRQLPQRYNKVVVVCNTLIRTRITLRLSPQLLQLQWFTTVVPSPPPPSPPSTEKAAATNDASTNIISPLQEILDISTKGVGQVIFLNSKSCGQILLGSLTIGDPFLVTMAIIGTLTSTISAKYILPLHLSSDTNNAFCNGLYSYNGCLVGCAASVFLSSSFASTSSLVLATTTLTMTGAAAATITTVLLNKLCPPMPQWTYAFNLVMLTALLRIQPLAPNNKISLAADVDITTTPAISTLDVITSPLNGLSQIFIIDSTWTGIGIVAAIASYSPNLAAHAIMGSTVGCIMGTLIYQVPMSEVTAGLWGYNAALTSLGIGVFFVQSKQTNILSFTGAIATSAVFGAIQPVFTSTPCLTIPFCFTMSACWLLGTPLSQKETAVIHGLFLATNPHSPEKNTLS